MIISQLQQKLMLALLLAVWLFLPFGRLSEIPVLVLSGWGIYLIIKVWKPLQSLQWFKGLTVLVGLYFLLTLFSAFDSYWPYKSYLVSFASWRFYFMGIAVLWIATAQSRQHQPNQTTLWSAADMSRRLINMMAIIAIFWCLDALLQTMMGYDLFMRTSYPGRLTGIFGDNVKLGPVLALMLPMVLIAVHHSSRWLRWLLFVLLMTVILLSGTRSAWLMAAFIWLMYGWQQLPQAKWRTALKAGVLVVILTAILAWTVPDFKDRLQRSAQLFNGDEVALDYALADRLPIWQSGWNMFQAHPINGVGARAFRYAYPEYAAADDPWLAQNGVSLQPHHWLMDLLAETGMLGFVLGLALMVMYIRLIKKHYRQPQIWPYAVALMSAFLPIVSLYSVFSSFWSICLWWLLIVSLMGVEHDTD